MTTNQNSLPPQENGWYIGNGEGAGRRRIEAVVRHCNPAKKLPNQIIQGRFEEDGFYFDDRSELALCWDIIKWRFL